MQVKIGVSRSVYLLLCGLAQLHHQVQKILRLLRLERHDKFLIVQAKAVGRVQLDAGIFVADLDVPVHDFLPLLQRQQIPIARFHERVDEQIFPLAGNDVRAALGGVERIELVDVHAALGHRHETNAAWSGKPRAASC